MRFLTDGDIFPGQRLRMAVRGLNELKLALVLENFEDALDLETRRIADPDLAGFLDALAKDLTRARGPSSLASTCPRARRPTSPTCSTCPWLSSPATST